MSDTIYEFLWMLMEEGKYDNAKKPYFCHLCPVLALSVRLTVLLCFIWPRGKWAALASQSSQTSLSWAGSRDSGNRQFIQHWLVVNRTFNMCLIGTVSGFKTTASKSEEIFQYTLREGPVFQ